MTPSHPGAGPEGRYDQHVDPRSADQQRADHTPQSPTDLGTHPLPSGRKGLGDLLSGERLGGVLLLLGAAVALVWANSPWREAYADLAGTVVGPSAVHLDLSLATWAADGLLAIFFFVVGLELKREIVAGSLRDPRTAAVPAIAAVGGMALPALVYVVVLLLFGAEGLQGWAVPTATDIAFAVAVLAVVGKGLPVGLRTFLLTLAVVDDLLAITIIAVFYTADLAVLWLLAALPAVVVFALLSRVRPGGTGLRVLLLAGMLVAAAVAWTMVHESGVHATVAGVVLGFTVPALARRGEDVSVAERFEHAVRPFSAAFALPVFAFFAAGVSVVDAGGLGSVLAQPVAVAVVLGLVLGKVLGILGLTAIIMRATPLSLPEGLKTLDLLGVAFLAGIGFTVSLLITELAFEVGDTQDGAKVAVLVGSLVSALAASVVLTLQKRRLGDSTPSGPRADS
ncbi:Na+/H+ antiporter NhaA [uncultured Pseudokineococcus sp.]|uniref:Na+/H+ antiporter NhaA n=1 Tax=uncultured Pseudokineococcus sp. TaxID=1642928 RepID=UPI002602CE66|nr:Na+/H+ antiporter NhaA [uncultured Pseudokineococcus sp.]